jgi:hypothetical protein
MSSYNRQYNAKRGGTQTSQREQELPEEALASHTRYHTRSVSRLFYPAQYVYDLKTLNPSNSASDKPA